MLRAEDRLTSQELAGAVVVIWVLTDARWHPLMFGVLGDERMEWHPWPSGCVPSTELAALASTGDLEPVGEEAEPGVVIAGERGSDIVAVAVDAGRPSRVARVAAENAALFAGEAAGQAIPDVAIQAVPLLTVQAPAAIEDRGAP